MNKHHHIHSAAGTRDTIPSSLPWTCRSCTWCRWIACHLQRHRKGSACGPRPHLWRAGRHTLWKCEEGDSTECKNVTLSLKVSVPKQGVNNTNSITWINFMGTSNIRAVYTQCTCPNYMYTQYTSFFSFNIGYCCKGLSLLLSLMRHLENLLENLSPCHKMLHSSQSMKNVVILFTFGWNSRFVVNLVRPVNSQRPIVLERRLDLLCESKWNNPLKWVTCLTVTKPVDRWLSTYLGQHLVEDLRWKLCVSRCHLVQETWC